jgi:hypothetical protein
MDEKTARLIRIDVDGSISTVRNEYEAIKDALGGWLEYAYIGHDLAAYVDEEGLLNDRELNVPISLMARRPIAGPAVLINARTDSEGNNLPPDPSWPILKATMALAEAWEKVFMQITLPKVDMDATPGEALFHVEEL